MPRDIAGACALADGSPSRHRVRQRILSGEADEGDLIPKLEDLMAEFGASKAAAREACRILQTEGLVSVVRGNVGGAVVHCPTPATAAYTVGLVLESREVAMPDVAAAIERFEPLCDPSQLVVRTVARALRRLDDRAYANPSGALALLPQAQRPSRLHDWLLLVTRRGRTSR